MDEADVGNEKAEFFLNAALRNVAVMPLPQPTGVCFNCEATLPSGFYCDSDCRDDHLKRQRLVMHNLKGED